ncbi:hypothetical protein [Serratia rubidaea]|uniref:hypothetical protein n=1 Tax=Serratia rubidaea TaxID=61652 RepID=UPI001783C02E|nr:hypothetical protein [Serratia rubidaea]MBD8453237.1 hypothetical protein [Serratia rubidaea]
MLRVLNKLLPPPIAIIVFTAMITTIINNVGLFFYDIYKNNQKEKSIDAAIKTEIKNNLLTLMAINKKNLTPIINKKSVDNFRLNMVIIDARNLINDDIYKSNISRLGIFTPAEIEDFIGFYTAQRILINNIDEYVIKNPTVSDKTNYNQKLYDSYVLYKNIGDKLLKKHQNLTQ